MPTPAFMHIEGTKQGVITKGTFTEKSVGNVFVKGHEDQFMVQAFDHTITIPRDPQSGQPTGQRVHQPITITKIFDKCSPLLYTALTTGEVLKKCDIKWYRTSVQGVQEHYFTIEMEDAIIVNLKARMPNCQDPANKSFTHLEEVSFSYRKIMWTHVLGGTSGADDWREPMV